MSDQARQRYIEQQSTIIEHHKRTKDLMAANEELADRLRKKLKEMDR